MHDDYFIITIIYILLIINSSPKKYSIVLNNLKSIQLLGSYSIIVINLSILLLVTTLVSDVVHKPHLRSRDKRI